MSGNGISSVDVITAAVGIGGLAVGIITYYWAQVSRRKEALFPIINEFDSSQEMRIAKLILDDFIIPKEDEWSHTINEYCFAWDEFPGGPAADNFKRFLVEKFAVNWVQNAQIVKNNNSITMTQGEESIKIIVYYEEKLGLMKINDVPIFGLILKIVNGTLQIGMDGYYHKSNLLVILRDHNAIPINDDGEIAIRASFDALLDFFVKLEYLLSIKVIKKGEIEYFKYYIDKTADEPPVIEYINKYEFLLRGKLHDNLYYEKSSSAK
jgi:hypothetical protein